MRDIPSAVSQADVAQVQTGRDDLNGIQFYEPEARQYHAGREVDQQWGYNSEGSTNIKAADRELARPLQLDQTSLANDISTNEKEDQYTYKGKSISREARKYPTLLNKVPENDERYRYRAPTINIVDPIGSLVAHLKSHSLPT